MAQISKHAAENPRNNPTGQIKDGALPLKDILTEFMAERVLPRQEVFEQLTSAWERTVPKDVAEHCSIASFSAGTLKVKVDSPSCLYQLQLDRSALVGEMQRLAPRCGLGNISFCVGQV